MKKTISEMDAALVRHYGILLGLEEPWGVAKVDLSVEAKRVVLRLEHDGGARFGCPECGKDCAVHDHAPLRRWRHLDTMQFETIIEAEVPRVGCGEHGVRTAAVPWAGKHSRFTLLFEHLAIKVILACRSLSQAADLLGLDWDAAEGIMRRAVARGMARRELGEIRYVGLDEKSFGRGQSYVSVMSDLGGRRVLEVTPDNDTDSGTRLWRSLPEPQRKEVLAAAMDMSAGFAAATRAEAPDAAVVHDIFHVSKHLNEAVDKVRRGEHRALLKEGGDSPLTGTRPLWLYNPINLSEQQAETFSQVVARNLKTARAWEIKETFAPFWHQPDARRGERFFNKWYARAIRSRLDPVKKVARMLKAHLLGLLSYFAHPITNATTEGLNSQIQAIKANARGFRSFESYRTRILFHLGKLEMSPLTG
jgi:transposase